MPLTLAMREDVHEKGTAAAWRSTRGSAGEQLIQALVPLPDSFLHTAGDEPVTVLEGVDEGR
jgi:hypothetical protein